MGACRIDQIGNTPLREVEGIWVKLECANPGGSVKDRVAKFLLEEAARRGELKPGDTVVEATSGNTGIALAMVARELGFRVMIFMPENISPERKRIIASLGAELKLTSREGSFAGAVAERDAYRGRPGYYVPDQFGNPDNTRCHEQTTGQEILRQLGERGVGRIDAWVAGTGTGGTLMGVARALRPTMPALQVVAVEPTESAVMTGGAAGEHGIMGIGDGFIPDLVDMKQVTGVEVVSTAEARAEAERLRRQHGFCVGMSSGANFLAALRVRARGLQVLTIFPDSADRYLSMGLEPSTSAEVSCPLHQGCTDRSHSMLPA